MCQTKMEKVLSQELERRDAKIKELEDELWKLKKAIREMEKEYVGCPEQEN